MDSLIKAFEAIVVEFSWRRLAVVVFLFGLGFAALATFDWYTRFFTLGRLERAEALVEKLVAVAPAVAASADESLKVAHAELVTQLHSLLAPRQPVVLSASGLWKFAAGTAPWLLFTLAYLPNVKRDPSNWSGVIGALFIGVMCGIVGQILPTSWATWPVLSSFAVSNFLVTVLFVLVWQARQNARKNKAAV